MKQRMIWMACLLAFVMSAFAQTRTQRHKHGDWYYGVGAGFSQSLAENAEGTDFIAHQLPSLNLMFGHNFTPALGIKFTGGVNMQVSRCSKVAEKVKPSVYGDGRYSFKALTASVSGILNMTNAFFGYEVERPLTWSFLVGAGVMKTFAFDQKLKIWNVTPKDDPYYPVNDEGGQYLVGHVGLQCDIRVNEPLDISVEFRANGTDNKYNGVANGNKLDFYLDLMVNLVYHFKNGKQQLRRFREPPLVSFVDPVLEDHSREYRETVRYGEVMYTVIPFYAGFYYMNDATTKRLEQVARFLQSHPLVNLCIVGHPDVIPDGDEEYHRQLGQKRAEAVREALLLKFHISPTRLRTSYDEKPLQSFKTLREWVPAVSFIMEDPGEEGHSFDYRN